MSGGMVSAAYIIASILFILSLGGLSHQETARRGNVYGIVGMALAIFATILSDQISTFWIIAIMMIIGAGVGTYVARRVEMTQMPELVAILHSFVGLAAVLVGYATFYDHDSQITDAEQTILNVEIFIGVFIGAITFTGSVIAFGKLSGQISSKPLMLPARNIINLSILLICFWLGSFFIGDNPFMASNAIIIMTLLAFVFGAHLVLAIGGADMPVVISMLNSYSGWAASATGFMLSNDLLIITGALVGSSGAILSYIMCKAMNRKFLSVILGGFGSGTTNNELASDIEGEVSEVSVEDTAYLLKQAENVVIIPGYGMAVAHAQQVVSELTAYLRINNTKVRFAIHPVAGRMPGHMNVLLAEAKVPYDIVLEMDEINQDFPITDVAIVIGANDIVNPSAMENPNSPIAGMPVLEAWKARTCIVSKRSLATGYAGVDNPLFYKNNTRMLFGDAKDSIESVVQYIKSSN